MKLPRKSSMAALRAGATVAALIAGSPLIGATAAQAQGTGNSVAASPTVAPNDYKRVPALRINGQPAYEVAGQLSRVSGATVLISSALATAPVRLNSLGGPVESVVAELAKALPAGTVVRAVFVPLGEGRPTADSISTYLDAQDVLRAGTRAGIPMPVPTPVPLPVPELPAYVPGQWEVLGHRMPLDKALAATANLEMRPVFLIQVTRNRLDPVAKASMLQAENMRTWLTLTPDQRNSLMDQQLSTLLNMPSTDRQAMLGQFMQQGMFMMQKMAQLPPEQKAQFMEDIKSAMSASGIPTGPNPGGGAPGK